MRKLLLILGVLVLLVLAGLAVFIATFDADRYRPLVVEQLQKTLGRPVTISHISLRLGSGIAAKVEGFSIAGQDSQPLISVESLSAVIRLMPLLHRQIEVASISLEHPSIFVMRNAQGQIDLTGLGAASSPAAAVGAPAPQASAAPINLQIGSIRVVDGTVHWKDALSQPPTEVTVNALNVTVKPIKSGQPMDVSLSAAVGGGQPNVSFQGRVLAPDGKQDGWIQQAELDAKRLSIEAFVPRQPGQPHPRGIFSTKLNFELPTLNQTELVQMLSAEGAIQLDDFVIEDMNILRSVLDKLSMLPGLMQRLEANLPPEYLKKLNAKDTTFAPVHLPVKLQGGALMLDPVDLKTDIAHLTGRGQVGILGRSVAMQTVFAIDPTLSSAIIRSVKELGALANASGELEIPVTIQGQMPKLSVLPNLNYVASKVVVNKAIDVISELLERKSGAAAGSQTPQTTGPDTSQAQPTPEELVGGLLRRALKKRLPSEETAPSQPTQ